jgi:CheY-like chemotaxis protein
MQLANLIDNYHGPSNKEFEAKFDSSSEQGITVLLIDDEEMVINISEMMLKNLGYKVLKAHSGFEGVRLFEENKSKIDLIISDLEMPKMNGEEVMDRLREIDPQIKVMLSSGALTDTDEQYVMNKGFNGFLKKPYDLDTLCEKMAEILN